MSHNFVPAFISSLILVMKTKKILKMYLILLGAFLVLSAFAIFAVCAVRYSALFMALLLWELSSARVCFVFRVFVWCERARRYLRRSFVCVTLCVSVVCCVLALACTAGARAQRV